MISTALIFMMPAPLLADTAITAEGISHAISIVRKQDIRGAHFTSTAVAVRATNPAHTGAAPRCFPVRRLFASTSFAQPAPSECNHGGRRRSSRRYALAEVVVKVMYALLG